MVYIYFFCNTLLNVSFHPILTTYPMTFIHHNFINYYLYIIRTAFVLFNIDIDYVGMHYKNYDEYGILMSYTLVLFVLICQYNRGNVIL